VGLGLGLWNIEHALGVVATHEFGHFLLQQGHCPASQLNNPACLKGGRIMQPGYETGNLAFYADAGGNQIFTQDQKPVIQRRCRALDARRRQ